MTLPRALMFQGTGSGVGKSVLVAGLARVLTRQGLRVRPIKPQNMSNNAAVTADGGEIGRAQALQAQACGIAPTVDMNPVLLKPQSDIGAQLVVRGHVKGAFKARDYQSIKRGLMPYVLDSFRSLTHGADIVLVEGAGSASEVNLREHDIANMGFAQAANVDVVLVGDIDRGGVIASLVGTQAVVTEADAQRIRGFIVNRMRGDPSLFSYGMHLIAEHTGWAPLGLVPDLDILRSLPAEDAQDLRERPHFTHTGRLKIVVPHMPLIANFDDLDPLSNTPDVKVIFVEPGQALPVCDLIILPGSKSTRSDLNTLYQQGWDVDIRAHVRRGGRVLGLCGGYQMLGHTITDPEGIEGACGYSPGLGLLDVTTELTPDKRLLAVKGTLVPEQVPLHGYEMHIGRTTGNDQARPFALIDQQPEGACSPNGLVWGTYLHGIMASGAIRQTLLGRLGLRVPCYQNHEDTVETALNAWADHLEQHINIPALLELARPVSL